MLRRPMADPLSRAHPPQSRHLWVAGPNTRAGTTRAYQEATAMPNSKPFPAAMDSSGQSTDNGWKPCLGPSRSTDAYGGVHDCSMVR
jgi:hypothetical protein